MTLHPDELMGGVSRGWWVSPQTIDRGQHFFSKRNQHMALTPIGYTVMHNHLKIRFALILFKLHEIWKVDSWESH